MYIIYRWSSVPVFCKFCQRNYNTRNCCSCLLLLLFNYAALLYVFHYSFYRRLMWRECLFLNVSSCKRTIHSCILVSCLMWLNPATLLLVHSDLGKMSRSDSREFIFYVHFSLLSLRSKTFGSFDFLTFE